MLRMSPRLLVLALAPLLATATAHAQAPGEAAPQAVDPYQSYPPYQAPPQVADPCAAGRASVMAHRFGIGVSIGGLGVQPDNAPDGSDTSFRVAELALRYRASLRFELELALTGGRQVLDDDSDGDLAMGSVTLGVRYRFMPGYKWSWWLMGGVGAAVVASHSSTADERDAAQRPVGMLGIGLERRFGRFALQVEARGMGFGPRQDQMEVTPTKGGASPPTVPESNPVAAEQLGGGTFTLGATYYF
jgi:hypothetical protein